MEIKYGQKYRNKTSKFLLPCLIQGHNAITTLKMGDLFILGCGLGDMSLESNPDFVFIDKSPIYLLLDRFAVKRKTEDFIYWVRFQEYFLKDYPMDLIGRAHMIVLDLPEKYYMSYDKFIEGKYSEMYTQKELDRFFIDDIEAYKVLSKDKSLLPQFALQLQKVFDLRELNPSEISNFELEFPYTLSKEEEFFNFESPH